MNSEPHQIQDMPQQPKKLARRPQFRGMPVPFTAMIDKNGVPDFKTTDTRQWYKCAKEDLCGLCGRPNKKGAVVFIGGGVCKETLCFFDPGMHAACAIYALRVCPFLAHKVGYKPIESVQGRHEVELHVDVTMSAPPERFYFFVANKWRLAKVVSKGGAAQTLFNIDPLQLRARSSIPKEEPEREATLKLLEERFA